jgi:hypothetical protein
MPLMTATMLRRRATTHWRPLAYRLGWGQATVDDALADADAFLTAHAGSACEMVVSARWVHAVAVDPALPSAEGWQAALQRWQAAHELDEQALLAAWVVRQARAPAVQVCTAMPKALVEGVTALARRHHVRLDRMGPWWAPEAAAWLEGPATQDAGEAALLTQTLNEPGWSVHLNWLRHEGRWQLADVWSEPGEAA